MHFKGIIKTSIEVKIEKLLGILLFRKISCENLWNLKFPYLKVPYSLYKFHQIFTILFVFIPLYLLKSI